jgi:rRNA-processing protein FCF1
MLTFTESVLKELKTLQEDTKGHVLSGAVPDMERYKFLMGRLEGLNMAVEAVKELANKYSADD